MDRRSEWVNSVVTEPVSLRVVDFLGVFYKTSGKLMVADEFEGTRDVALGLESFLGTLVKIVAHHRPLDPPDQTRWGGGSCFLESSGHCHFGHHEDPQNLFLFNKAGVLRCEEGEWSLLSTEEDCKLLLNVLEGHRGQIIVMTVPEVEEIDQAVREATQADLTNASAEELEEHLRNTRTLLQQINRLKNDIDV